MEGGEFTAPDGSRVVFAAGTATHFTAGQVHGGLTATSATPIVIYTTPALAEGKPLNVPAD